MYNIINNELYFIVDFVLPCFFIGQLDNNWGRHGCDRMVIGFLTTYQSVPITTNILTSNPAQTMCTQYNIMWSSLSVTCDRSVVISGFLSVLISVLWWTLRFPYKNYVQFFFTLSCFRSLFTLFVFLCQEWCPTHIVLCFCLVFLRLLYHMWLVSLDSPFWLDLRYSLTFI